MEDIRETEYFYSFAEYPDTFINAFELYKMPTRENALLATYFAFTSLSTVGFGDFYPKDDVERVFCAFMLLIGVAIFSLVMGNFIAILDLYNEFEADFNDGK